MQVSIKYDECFWLHAASSWWNPGFTTQKQIPLISPQIVLQIILHLHLLVLYSLLFFLFVLFHLLIKHQKSISAISSIHLILELENPFQTEFCWIFRSYIFFVFFQILDRKNNEIDELKTLYRNKQKEAEEMNKMLEKRGKHCKGYSKGSSWLWN